MLNWSNRPPADSGPPGLPIVRAPSRGALNAIALNDDLIGTATHFWKGRTLPCTQPDCEACRDGLPWRWHAYLAALDAKDRRPILLELTAQAAERIADWLAEGNNLRGVLFGMTRPSGRPNGRVVVRRIPTDEPITDLPPAPDVKAILTQLWNIPTNGATTTPTRKGSRVLKPDSKRISDNQTQPMPGTSTSDR